MKTCVSMLMSSVTVTDLVRYFSWYNIHDAFASFRFGASILVDTPTSSVAFDRLLFNPQCFALYDDPATPPSMWSNVSMHSYS